MKIERNVKDTKNNVKSLVTRNYFCYLHRYVLSLNGINIWRSKAVSTLFPSNPTFSPYNPTTSPVQLLPHQTCQSCLRVFILLYYLQSDSGGRGVYGGGSGGVRGRGRRWWLRRRRWWWGDDLFVYSRQKYLGTPQRLFKMAANLIRRKSNLPHHWVNHTVSYL